MLGSPRRRRAITSKAAGCRSAARGAARAAPLSSACVVRCRTIVRDSGAIRRTTWKRAGTGSHPDRPARCGPTTGANLLRPLCRAAGRKHCRLTARRSLHRTRWGWWHRDGCGPSFPASLRDRSGAEKASDAAVLPPMPGLERTAPTSRRHNRNRNCTPVFRVGMGQEGGRLTGRRDHSSRLQGFSGHVCGRSEITVGPQSDRVASDQTSACHHFRH